MADKNVNIKVTAESKEAESSLKKLTSSINKLGKSSTMKGISNLSNAVTASIAVFDKLKVAVEGVVESIADCVNAYNTQRQAEIQLEAAAKNNPYLNSTSVANLKEYASQLSKTAAVADEKLLPVMAKLAASGRTEAEVMKIVATSLDVAASGTMSLESAADAMNKAFEGSVSSLQSAIPVLKNVSKAQSGAASGFSSISTSLVEAEKSAISATEAVRGLNTEQKELSESAAGIGTAFSQAASAASSSLGEVGKSVTAAVDAVKGLKAEQKGLGDSAASLEGAFNAAAKGASKVTTSLEGATAAAAQTTAQAKAFTSEQREAEAAIDDIAAAYQGMAASMAEALGGAERLNNAINTIKEELGAALSGPINAAQSMLAGFLENFTRGMQQARQNTNRLRELSNKEDKTTEESLEQAQLQLEKLEAQANAVVEEWKRNIGSSTVVGVEEALKQSLAKDKSYQALLTQIAVEEGKILDLKKQRSIEAGKEAAAAYEMVQLEKQQNEAQRQAEAANKAIAAYQERVRLEEEAIAAARRTGEQISALDEKQRMLNTKASAYVSLMQTAQKEGITSTVSSFSSSVASDIQGLRSQVAALEAQEEAARLAAEEARRAAEAEAAEAARLEALRQAYTEARQEALAEVEAERAYGMEVSELEEAERILNALVSAAEDLREKGGIDIGEAFFTNTALPEIEKQREQVEALRAEAEAARLAEEEARRAAEAEAAEAAKMEALYQAYAEARKNALAEVEAERAYGMEVSELEEAERVLNALIAAADDLRQKGGIDIGEAFFTNTALPEIEKQREQVEALRAEAEAARLAEEEARKAAEEEARALQELQALIEDYNTAEQRVRDTINTRRTVGKEEISELEELQAIFDEVVASAIALYEKGGISLDDEIFAGANGVYATIERLQKEIEAEQLRLQLIIDQETLEAELQDKIEALREMLEEAASRAIPAWRNLSDEVLSYSEALEEVRHALPDDEIAELEAQIARVKETLTFEDTRTAWGKLFDESVEMAERAAELEIAAEQAKNEEKLALAQAYYEEAARLQEQAIKREKEAEKALFEYRVQSYVDLLSKVNDIVGTITDAVSSLSDTLLEAAENRLSATLDNLEIAYLKGEMSEEEYNEAVTKAKQESAKEQYKIQMWDWSASILSATANIAQGVTKAIAQGGVAGIITGLAVSAAGAAQIASIIASKPIPPSFSTGGIVGGTSYTGDRVQAMLNSGEMVLNTGQQRNLFDSINSGQLGSGGVNIVINNSAANLVSAEPQITEKQINIMIDARVNESLQKGRYNQALTMAEQSQSGKYYGV